jgi:hypothetical protein
MEMPLPDNTAAMMAGEGPFGAVGMGGMFSVVKVRKDQKPGDYTDPGWYTHPPGTVAYEFTGALPEPSRFQAQGGRSMPPMAAPKRDIEVKARNNLDRAVESVTPRQARRIAAAARQCMAEDRRAALQACRFDIVAVSPYHWPQHIENAFEGDG